MKQDFMKNLPSEITNNIFSKLPLRAVAVSKCVCKPWLDLLESDYFAKSHLSKIKTSPALALLRLAPMCSTRCTVFELENEVDLECRDLHYNPLTNFVFPFEESSMEGTAANGFLLLYSSPSNIYICNPLTREYVELCCPIKSISYHRLNCGFGVSKVSGQHKVVCISSYHVYVYTLGTGSWRCVEASATCGYTFGYNGNRACIGQFVDGNLYWSALDSFDTQWICCFDVETEGFSFFFPPELTGEWDLSVLRDCLCVCYTAWTEGEIDIWLMKVDGVKKSWTMEYVLRENYAYFDYPFHCHLKVFQDGDIFFFWYNGNPLLYCSNKTKTIQQISMFLMLDAPAWYVSIYPLIFTRSLLSLKSFGMENVISF